LRDPEHFAQPLQARWRSRRARLRDEPFEQAKARRDELAFVAGRLFSTATRTRDACGERLRWAL
jgi:hypothetical protein